jgi:hypothetical protein
LDLPVVAIWPRGIEKWSSLPWFNALSDFGELEKNAPQTSEFGLV